MMTPDLILYRYLVTRNFCRVLKSPALILFALKSYQQIERVELSEDNPAKTLKNLQSMFANSSVKTTRDSGKYIDTNSITDMPEYKKAYFDAIAFYLCDKVMTSRLINPDFSEAEIYEFQDLNQFLLKELQILLRKEVLKIQDKTDFRFDESVPVDYKKEKDIFESQYFKLSVLETIYIYILKFIHYVSSCCRQSNNKVSPTM